MMVRPDEGTIVPLKSKFSSSGDGRSGEGGWLSPIGLCDLEVQWALPWPWRSTCTMGLRACLNDDAMGQTQWRSESTS